MGGAMMTRMAVGALLLGSILHLASAEVQAQERDRTAAPDSASFGFGLHSFVSDQPSWRVGGVVYLSRTARLSATARFRGDDSYIEVEHRWLRDSRRALRPFLSLSGVWLKENVQRSLGPAVGGGIEVYPVRPVVLEASLTWHSLLDIGSSADRYGFRMSAGMSLVPFDWPW